jgi:hypothetical protein
VPILTENAHNGIRVRLSALTSCKTKKRAVEKYNPRQLHKDPPPKKKQTKNKQKTKQKTEELTKREMAEPRTGHDEKRDDRTTHWA